MGLEPEDNKRMYDHPMDQVNSVRVVTQLDPGPCKRLPDALLIAVDQCDDREGTDEGWRKYCNKGTGRRNVYSQKDRDSQPNSAIHPSEGFARCMCDPTNAERGHKIRKENGNKIGLWGILGWLRSSLSCRVH